MKYNFEKYEYSGCSSWIGACGGRPAPWESAAGGGRQGEATRAARAADGRVEDTPAGDDRHDVVRAAKSPSG